MTTVGGIMTLTPALSFGFGDRDSNSVAHSYWLGKEELIVAIYAAYDF